MPARSVSAECIYCCLVVRVVHHGETSVGGDRPKLGPCAIARRATADTAEGLERDLYLAKGAKVMLTKNLYQQVGLVNGIRGQVVELVLADDAPPPNLPFTLSSSSEGTQGGSGRLRRDIEGMCRFLP